MTPTTTLERKWVQLGLLSLACLLALGLWWRPEWLAGLGGSALLVGAILIATRAGALQRADDLTVARLGDAEGLVRALNTIHQDELRLGKLAFAARPDIHARAERLVKKHRLRLAPEAREGGCSLGGNEPQEQVRG